MSLTLVFVGAAAGLAPAVSLRALAGGGAVFFRQVSTASWAISSPIPSRAAAAVWSCSRPPSQLRSRSSPVGPGRTTSWSRSQGRTVRTSRVSCGLAAPSPSRRSRPAASFDDALLGQELVSLKRIVDVLRVECPWDREQTPRDIIGYTIEEVYELADAVADGDLDAERGELGDLLLQVVLLALMLDEQQAGDLGVVTQRDRGQARAPSPAHLRGWRRRDRG